MDHSSVIRRFLPTVLLAIAGAAVAGVLAPHEKSAVLDHLAGFPDSHAFAHYLRPAVLSAMCFIPAMIAMYYSLVRALDRYLIRQFLISFALCFGGLYGVWGILDLTENVSEFQKSADPWSLVGRYYLITFAPVFVQMAPFGLLLALLHSLGKLSKAQEVVSMIQTGRGIARLILPLAVIGFFASLACLGFNYQWAPWAQEYKDTLLDEADSDASNKAVNVPFYHKGSGRFWLVGVFPYNYNIGEPLRNIVIRTTDENRMPNWRLEAEEAHWNRESGEWTFHGVRIANLDAAIDPNSTKPPFENPEGPVVFNDWPETPWRLIKPGLEAEHLGIPDLYSWILSNRNTEWINKERFLTQWHYRWAQPAICLAIVLLAAPLGISFSRRGAGGGVVLAIFLSAGMMFSSTVFLSLGESSKIPPIWAAWGTNLCAFIVAIILIQRRLVGRPIFQTLKKLLPN